MPEFDLSGNGARQKFVEDSIERYDESGLSLRRFCRQQHLPRSTFQKWLSKEFAVRAPKQRGNQKPLLGELENELRVWQFEERSKGLAVLKEDILRSTLFYFLP